MAGENKCGICKITATCCYMWHRKRRSLELEREDDGIFGEDGGQSDARAGHVDKMSAGTLTKTAKPQNHKGYRRKGRRSCDGRTARRGTWQDHGRTSDGRRRLWI